MTVNVRRCSWFLTVVPVGAVAVAMEKTETLLLLLNSIISIQFFQFRNTPKSDKGPVMEPQPLIRSRKMSLMLLQNTGISSYLRN
jgi:hypothetical protein